MTSSLVVVVLVALVALSSVSAAPALTVLNIPDARATVTSTNCIYNHIVTESDTCESILKTTGMCLNQLVLNNPMLDCDAIEKSKGLPICTDTSRMQVCTLSSCTAALKAQLDDTCDSLVALYNMPGRRSLRKLNPWINCQSDATNLIPGVEICLSTQPDGSITFPPTSTTTIYSTMMPTPTETPTLVYSAATGSPTV